jgi:AraC-like DNA-binding protein
VAVSAEIVATQRVFPGIHGFPMSQRPLLHTRELGRAVQVIHDLVEPFHFSWDRTPAHADIRITGVVLEKLKLFGVYHGAPVLVQSGMLQSHYIVVPLQGDVVGTINSARIRAIPGEALMYPAGTCLHAHWSEHCVALVLAIAREELGLAARRYLATASSSPSLMPKLDLSAGAGRSFANVLGCLCAENDNARDGNPAPGVKTGLQDLLLSSLVSMNSQLWQQGLEHASTRRRRTGVARAIEYIERNVHRAVGIGELSRIACLSSRSLQMGFAECFDIGPMTYSRRVRLSRAREELTTSDPREVQVSDLVARWGFPSASAFTRLYRQSFGELPSQTLKEVRRSLHRNAAKSPQPGRC